MVKRHPDVVVDGADGAPKRADLCLNGIIEGEMVHCERAKSVLPRGKSHVGIEVGTHFGMKHPWGLCQKLTTKCKAYVGFHKIGCPTGVTKRKDFPFSSAIQGDRKKRE